MPKVRFNKNTGTITTKAGTFSLDDLWRQIDQINKQSQALSKQITRNPYYPRDLGLNTDPVRFIRRELDDLERLAIRGEVSPTLSASLDRLKRLQKPSAVERAFWGAVGQTYGVTGAQARILAPKGKLTSPKAKRKRIQARDEDGETGEETKARYEPLVKWTREKIPHVDARKLVNLSQEELLQIAQQWNTTGTIPRAVTRPFAKKTR